MNEILPITIYVFGNPDIFNDSAPLRMVPQLKNRFPNISFEIKDPNELDIPEANTLIIIDTVLGLKHVRWVSLEEIAEQKSRVTAHDFDLATYLLLLRKIKKNITVHILGIPSETQENYSQIITDVTLKIHTFITKKSRV